MDIFDAFEMSPSAMDKGLWTDLVVNDTKIGRLRVRSSDPDINPDYRRALSVAALASLEVDADQVEDLKNKTAIAIAAECLLTDWELYKADKNGVERPIKFSAKKAVELLTKMPKLRAAVERAATGWSKFRKEAVSDAVKS